MKSLPLNLPDWCPAWMTKHAEGKPATWGSALLHGLLFPILVFLLLVNEVRVGTVVVLGGDCYLLYFRILDHQQRSLFEIFSRAAFGLIANGPDGSHQAATLATAQTPTNTATRTLVASETRSRCRFRFGPKPANVTSRVL